LADNRALYLALDLARTPGLARVIRSRPLPPDVLRLIRIAAGSPDAVADAVRSTGEDAETIGAAAKLFLQQGLFRAGGDHYRTLGLSTGAPSDKLSEHVRWLMKWLHPDHDQAAWDSTLAERVLTAWHELKDPGRRAAYDRALRTKSGAAANRNSARQKSPRPQKYGRKPSWRIVAESYRSIRTRQILAIVFVCAAIAIIVLFSDRVIPLAAGILSLAQQ
jgi:hypothetical protein